ncbi:3-hydroxyisobutyrate dehydrogenase [Actinomycetota bacterium]|nr:3-hydroxyisobutyrate dehydrogenase [Actinomycetota bacterium]
MSAQPVTPQDGPRVAVLGTGIMGAGITRSLRRAGLPVTVWNRTAERALALADSGAVVAGSVAEAVRDADVVLTVLFDTKAVLAVGQQLAEAMRPDAIWVQAATIGLDGTRDVAGLAAAHGLTVVEAMMLGTRQPAETGRLVLLAAGDSALRDRLASVLDAISAKVVWAGEQLGQGTALKLVCNAWITALTAALGQSITLADGLGLDPHLFLEAIAGGQSDTPYAHLKGAAMLTGAVEPQFALDGARKDLGLIEAAARGTGMDTGLVQALRAVYDRAAEQGHGGEDIATVVTGFRAGTERR